MRIKVREMKTDTSCIIIRPEDISTKRPNDFSQEIVSSLLEAPEINVIGISSAIFFACSSVNITRDLADIHINHLELDYIEYPVIGKFEGVFFNLSRKKTVDWESEARALSEKMKLTFDRDGQLVVVSKRQSIDKLRMICLWKLSRMNLLKIIGAGTAINNAVRIALQISRGGIAKEPVAIKLVSIQSLEAKEAEAQKTTTGIEIFLERGKETEYSKKHNELLRTLKKAVI